MAELGKPGEPEPFIPPISQETLAEMVGTTRSRVSFFMNRFRRLGFIEYKGRIKVHKSLLNAVLLDRLPELAARNRLLLPLHELDRSCQERLAGAELSKFELGVVSTARIRTHVRAERKQASPRSVLPWR